ncbi:MAG: hypothetical protein BWZ10_00105 [candidate division BRC1 bacterium ADurb.BinA364]|nr:MAG: hypothetical protein BWZ10_00105 [candidate division BRC1 bacterium ADurb.BinA364]
MTMFLATLGFFAAIMLLMGIGAMCGRNCLRGSCGGSKPIAGPDGQSLVCPNCDKRIDKAR